MKANGYSDIVEHIRQRIESGELGVGTRLSSIRKWATDYRVNYNTAHRAAAELQRMGYIVANGVHGCSVAEGWSRTEATPHQTSWHKPSQRPLRIGMVVSYPADTYATAAPPQLVFLERLLTSRVCAEGSTFTHFWAKDPDLLLRLADAPIDALVIPRDADARQREIIAATQNAGKACILYSGTVANELDCDTVRIDDAWAFRLVTERLWLLGHRRIAFVGLDAAKPGCEWCDVRENAWRQVLLAKGLTETGRDAFVLDDTFHPSSFPDRLGGYTAVVCANDNVAATVMVGLRDRGFRVPENLSISGYDDARDERIPDGVNTFTLPYERVVAALLSLAKRRVMGDEESGDKIVVTLRPVLVPRRTWREVPAVMAQP